MGRIVASVPTLNALAEGRRQVVDHRPISGRPKVNPTQYSLARVTAALGEELGGPCSWRVTWYGTRRSAETRV